MKKVLLLLAVIALAGCASPGAGKTSSQSQSNTGSSALVVGAAPRYEHQLEIEYADGATAFLRLVQVRDP